GKVSGAEACDGGTGCTPTCDRAPVCGDGVVDGSEGCDDGGVKDGDGCSAVCVVETTAETEPNDTFGAADATVLGAIAHQTVTGAIGAVGDKDVLELVTTADGVYRLETSKDGVTCDFATTVTLLDSTGVALFSDTNSGVASCS